MKINCLQCSGFGVLFSWDGKHSITCDLCKGKGRIKDKHVVWRLQGEILKDERLKRKLTLRKCSAKFNIDPSNLSKMERGIIKPINIFNQ